MNLRSQLREQSRRSLRVSTSRRTRAAVLVWWEKDKAADALCRAISPAFHSLYRSRPVNAASDLSSYLLDLQHSGELTDSSAVYLLWVWNQTPPPDLGVIMQPFENQPRFLTADVCRISNTADASIAGYRYEWRIGADTTSDADTLAVLLMLASTTDIPLDPRTSGQIFRVRSTLNNSVERDLARQLIERLEGMLEGDRRHWEERFRNAFGPHKSVIESLYNSLPNPKDLPIPGVPRLADLLEKDDPGLITALRQWMNGSAERYASISVREALEALFGKAGHRSMCEHLRMVLPEYLPALCKKRLNEMEIVGRCYQQPIRLLQEGASLSASFREKAYAGQLAKQEVCDKLLGQKFFPRGTSISAFLSGLENYLQIWKEYICCAVETAWWEETGRIFAADSRMMQEVCAQHEILDRGLRSIADIDIYSQRREDVNFTIDWKGKTPESLLSGLYSQAEFSLKEAVQLIERSQASADQWRHGTRYRENFILYSGSLAELEQVEDIHGQPVFHRNEGALSLCGAAGKLRILSLPQIGKQSLWEICVDACQ